MAKAQSTSILPFVPRPLPDEILSSWLSRIGCHYDLDPTEILHSLDPEQSIYSPHEIDWGMSKEKVRCLAAAARMSLHDVVSLDAAVVHPRWARYWFSVDSCGYDPWNNHDLYGPEFEWAWCNLCLIREYARTGHQYIRLPWTLACVGYCSEHRRMLTNHCACGATHRPIHVAEGSRTRLICRFCKRSIAQDILPGTQGSTRLECAVDLQIAFERDIIEALEGRLPSAKWCGRSSAKQFLALVDDIANAVCSPRPDRYCPAVVSFAPASKGVDRFPHLPDMDHKMCALSPFWRANGIAAVLSIIGTENVCRIMSTDLDRSRSGSALRLLRWRGSFEWLLAKLDLHDIRRLIDRSSRWPAAPRKRLRAWVEKDQPFGRCRA